MTCPRCEGGMGPYRTPAGRYVKPPEEPRHPNYLSPDEEERERLSFAEACNHGALVSALVFAALLGLGMLLEKAHPGPGPLEKIKAQEIAMDAGVVGAEGR